MKRLTEKLTTNSMRYVLKSKNDAIIQPYGSYELFYEITFEVIQKLGKYEDLGTLEELEYAKKFLERVESTTVGDMQDSLEPLKIKAALDSELFKLKYKLDHKPSEISVLDYTIINSLIFCLRENTKSQILKKNLEKAMEIFSDNCKSVRYCSGEDLVCGWCKWDCDTSIGPSGDPFCECPGFESDDCFELNVEKYKKAIEGEEKNAL